MAFYLNEPNGIDLLCLICLRLSKLKLNFDKPPLQCKPPPKEVQGRF